MNEINERTYDIVDPEGNVVEQAIQPVEPVKMPTEGELKRLRRQHVTIHLPRVIACGHRLNLGKQPRQRNCEHCWFTWFQNHGEIVQQLDEMKAQHGEHLIVQLQGKKFLHRWLQFMATIASWKAVEESNA